MPAGWAEQTGAEVAEIDDLAALNQGASELDGYVATYKRDGQNTKEFRRARLYVEVRIGELLGPGEPTAGPGRGKPSVAPDGFSDRQQRHELRQLAWRDGEQISDEARAAGCSYRPGTSCRSGRKFQGGDAEGFSYLFAGVALTSR